MGIYIIGEAGVNHNGNIDVAKKLIDVAESCGCDAVKFQTFKAENIVTKTADKAEYQLKSTDETESQLDMLKKLELKYEIHRELMEYCRQKGIDFLSTPFDEESVDFLESLNIQAYKIPSGEITNKPYIQLVAGKNKPIILSTGMATVEEVSKAISWIIEEGNKQISLLHCTTNYPTAVEEVNLKAMLTLKEEFALPVGYSDHTNGYEVPIAAAALGAEILEKHFTLDKNMEGPDHKASLEPEELKLMVQAVRNVEKCLGDGIKKPTESELKNMKIMRKSIVAAKEIKEGEVIEREHLVIKRPGTGVEPDKMDLFVGRVAKKFIPADSMMKLEFI